MEVEDFDIAIKLTMLVCSLESLHIPSCIFETYFGDLWSKVMAKRIDKKNVGKWIIHWKKWSVGKEGRHIKKKQTRVDLYLPPHQKLNSECIKEFCKPYKCNSRNTIWRVVDVISGQAVKHAASLYNDKRAHRHWHWCVNTWLVQQ